MLSCSMLVKGLVNHDYNRLQPISSKDKQKLKRTMVVPWSVNYERRGEEKGADRLPVKIAWLYDFKLPEIFS